MSASFQAGKILKGGFVYTLVSLLQRSLSFLLLPFYARALTPAEFGEISVISTITALIGTALAFGVESAVFRQYFALKHDLGAQRSYLSTIGAFMLIVPVGVSAVLGVVSMLFLPSTWALDPLALSLGILAVGLSAFGRAIILPLQRVERSLRPFVIFSCLSVIPTVVLTVVFIVGLEWVPAGWFLAQLAGAFVALPYGLLLFRPHWVRQFDLEGLKHALRFGVPIVPHQIAHWSLSVADRAILAMFVSPAMVGVYSMGYQITSVLGNVLTSVNQTLMPEYARTAEVGTDATGPLRKSASFQIVFSGFLAVGAALVVPPAIELMLPAQYGAAARLIPWIALGYFFFGAYYIPMNVLTLVKGDTKWNWVFTIFAGISAVGLNFLLIPAWGTTAAAAVTMVGYALLFAMISAYGHLKYGAVWPFDHGVVAKRLAVLLLISMIGLIFRPDGAWFALGTGLVLTLAACVATLTIILPVQSITTGRFGSSRLARKTTT